MATRPKAKFKLITPNQKYHACISYHETVKETVNKHIVCELRKLGFDIQEVSCDDKSNFLKILKESDAWVEVLTEEYRKCACCKSRYDKFTKTREETKTKSLQKLLHLQVPECETMKLRVHSDYSADVDAFSGEGSSWFDDLQLAIVVRFHAFLSYHESDDKMAKKIMEWLKENGYLFTYRRKFLSLGDAKKAAVDDKMSNKIISLFSDSYVNNREEFDTLVLPVANDRAQAAWIPVVLEGSNQINDVLDYLPRINLMFNNKNGLESSDIWKTEMEKLKKGLDNSDGLPLETGIKRRDGPPGLISYEKMKTVVHSVGKLTVKVSELHQPCFGTAFCIGKDDDKDHRYVFTAYHTIAVLIDSIIRSETENGKKEDLLKKICFSKEEIICNKDCVFKQTKPGKLLFSEIVGNIEELEKKWNVKIDFLNEKRETLCVQVDIPFLSQEHDVILLKLKPKSSTASFIPKPLKLNLDSINKFWHLTGFQVKDKFKAVHTAAWCPVFEAQSFKLSECWWTRRKYDSSEHEETHEDFLQLDRLGYIPFKCTTDFQHGASGSPCWCEINDEVHVQGMYLGCLPEAYFTQDDKDLPADLAFRHRPEKALPMKKIHKILENSEMQNLILDLYK
ncbi:uncharacterized protein LOC132562852 [Ylistrum balloti]|uniref:uncharacterized protein LOC132562852 n=1 Tax=Ylistrum balloti TaxID=509963 RepID=UPI0029058DF1|nr:uncharacterized protein LOC132562852 [Ylistrum balloti]